MDAFDIIWKLGVLLILISISGSIGTIALALKAQAETYMASEQQEG